MKLYFTNPTNDRHKAREVQLRLEKETSLTLMNPFYAADGTPTEEIKFLDNGERPNVSTSEIVSVDKKMIRDSDGILGWVSDKTSWGSIQEFIWCYEVVNKPVYIIFQDTHGWINHPWAIEHSTRRFGTIEGFVTFAKEKLR